MAYPIAPIADVSGCSMSRKHKFISKCAPPAFIFVFLYLLIFIALLACDKETLVFPRLLPGLATIPKSYPLSSSLTAYEKWHRLQRECLIDSSCNNPPLLIWQCPESNATEHASLDHHFQGIQFSFLLAIATKRLFLIEWPAFSYPLDDVLVPGTFDWTIPTSMNLNSPVLNWISCFHNRLCNDATSFPSVRRLPAPYYNEPDFNLEEDDLWARLEKYPELRIWTRLPPESLQSLNSNPQIVNFFSAYKHMNILELRSILLVCLFKPTEHLKGVLKFSQKDVETAYRIAHVRAGDIGEGRNLRLTKVNSKVK